MHFFENKRAAADGFSSSSSPLCESVRPTPESDSQFRELREPDSQGAGSGASQRLVVVDEEASGGRLWGALTTAHESPGALVATEEAGR